MRYKLRIQMVLFNVLISVVPLILIGFIAYTIHLHNIKKNISESVDILFTQVNSRISEYFDEMNGISKSVFLNKSLQTIHQTETDKWTRFTWIQNHLNAYLETNQSITGIYWKDGEGNVYNTSAFLLGNEIEQEILKADKDRLSSGELVFSGPIVKNGEAIDEYLALRLVKSVIQTNYLKSQGVGVLILDRTRLSSMIESSELHENSKFFIVDNRNRIIVSTDTELAGRQLNNEYFNEQYDNQLVSIGEETHLIKMRSVNKVGWKLVAAIPTKELFAEADVFKTYITLIVIVIFIIVVVITLLFNMALTRPINTLIDAFAQVASGDLQSKVRISGKNEITRMAVHFNRMVKEVGELTHRQAAMKHELYETELQKKHFELNGLQSQINAHFLYNTLHTLRGMIVSSSTDEASEVVDNLVDYFRYCSQDNAYVQLGAELDYLNTYLNIQKARFGDRLKIMLDTDERLHGQMILKLLIQPLVENSVFYGIEQKTGTGIIKIRAAYAGSCMTIKIYDNGRGIDPLKVAQMNEALADSGRTRAPAAQAVTDGPATGLKDKRSIGIMNINKRLKLHYGAEYGLRIKSWENIGTVIIMTLPCEEADHV